MGALGVDLRTRPRQARPPRGPSPKAGSRGLDRLDHRRGTCLRGRPAVCMCPLRTHAASVKVGSRDLETRPTPSDAPQSPRGRRGRDTAWGIPLGVRDGARPRGFPTPRSGRGFESGARRPARRSQNARRTTDAPAAAHAAARPPQAARCGSPTRPARCAGSRVPAGRDTAPRSVPQPHCAGWAGSTACRWASRQSTAIARSVRRDASSVLRSARLTRSFSRTSRMPPRGVESKLPASRLRSSSTSATRSAMVWSFAANSAVAFSTRCRVDILQLGVEPKPERNMVGVATFGPIGAGVPHAERADNLIGRRREMERLHRPAAQALCVNVLIQRIGVGHSNSCGRWGNNATSLRELNEVRLSSGIEL